MEKKLMRSKDGMFLGVCAGFAKYLGVDPIVVRVVVALLSFFLAFFGGIVAYILVALIMPRER